MARSDQDDIAFIRSLAELLRETELSEIEIARQYGEDQELNVRLARASAAPVALAPAPAAAVPPAAAPAPAPAAAPAAQAEDPLSHPGLVTSPMVGTAYAAPEPGAEPFVKSGDTVAEGQTLLIVEAMKTMNHIPAPRAGVVRTVIFEDRQPVEFGAPLVIIE